MTGVSKRGKEKVGRLRRPTFSFFFSDSRHVERGEAESRHLLAMKKFSTKRQVFNNSYTKIEIFALY